MVRSDKTQLVSKHHNLAPQSTPWLRGLLIAAVAGIFAVTASAKTLTWQGTVTATWENATNWFDEVNLITSTTAPTSADAVTINNSRGATSQPVVTAAAQAAKSLTVGNGFTLTLSGANGTLTVGDGVTGNNDITIQNGGTIINSSTATATFALTGSSVDTFRIDSGGTYVHNTTKSYTTPFPAGSQNFDPNSTFIWRGSSTLAPSLVFSSRTFGNVSIESTSGTCTPAANTGTGVCNVNGNLTVGVNGVVNYTLSSATVTSPWLVAGNIIVGAGSTLSFAALPITLSGNLTNNGTMTVNSTSGIFTFSGPSSTVAGTAAVTFSNSFLIPSGKAVTLLQNATTVNGITTNNGTLNCGTSIISGTAGFNLVSGATLGIGSANGITSSGASGNIQVGGTRTFSSGANYIYNGSVAQATGSGLPSSVNNLTINNTLPVASGGVALTGNVTVNGQLNLTAGRLITGANQVSVADAASLSPAAGSSSAYVDGNLQKAFASTGTKSFIFPIGTGAVFAPCAVTNMVVTTSGSLTASTTNIDHPNIGSSTLVSTQDANRYWTMTPGGGFAVSGFSAVCTPDNSDLDGGANIASFVMENWNGSSWTLASSSAVSGNSVTGNGLSSFGDFAVGQLQAIPTNPSGVGNSPSVGRGGTALLTVTVTPGSNPTSTGISVTADLSLIGGSVAQTFVDDGTGGDVTAGDNVFSYTATVTTGTSVGIKALPVSITDAQSRSGSATISVSVVGMSRVWSGNGPDDNWTTATNWSGNIAPISPQDSVIFAGTTRPTPALDTSYTVPGLTFDNSAGSFTLGAVGNSTLTLNGGTGVTNNSANPETVNIPIIFGSPQTFEAAGAGTLTFASTITNSGNLLTVDGANNSAINGAISGGGGLTKIGNGTLSLSGGNTYGGATTVNGGTLSISGGAAIPDASAITLANAAGVTLSVNASETAGSLAGGGGTGGTVALGANNLSVGGTTTYSGAITGTGKLIMTGPGTLTLSNSGAIGGSFVTRVEGGTIDLNRGGLAIGGMLGSGNIIELAGGTIQFSGNVQANIGVTNGEMDVYSDSTFSINRNSTATSSTSPAFGFPLDFKSNANLSFIYNDRITNGTTTFSAPTTLEANGGLTLGAFAVTLSAAIGESGGSHSFTKAGPGTLALSVLNTYSGNTTNLAGVISLNGSSTLGNGSGALVLAGGDVVFTANRPTVPISNAVVIATSGTNSLYGNSTTATTRIVPFSGAFGGSVGTLRFGNTGIAGSTYEPRLIGGGFTFAQPLLVGDPAFDTSGAITLLQLDNDNTIAPQEFDGVIAGNGSVLRDAPASGTGGTTILSGANIFAGGTTISGGFIGFGANSTSSGGVVTSGPVGTGTLEIGNDPNVGFFAFGMARTVENRVFLNAVTNAQILGSNDLTMAGTWNIGTVGKTLTVNNTGLTTISGVLTNTAAVTKSGTGTLVLSGVNTDSGNLTVANGTLALSGSASIANVPSITVAGGATFDVSGLSLAFALGAGQTLANNSSTAILAGSAATGSGIVALNYSGSPSFIVTNGTLTLSAGTVLNINNTGAALGAGTYKLIAAASTGNVGAVAGTVPTTFTVGGAGTTSSAALQIINNELYLVVGVTTTALSSSDLVTGYLNPVTFTALVQTNGLTATDATGNVVFETNGVPLSTNAVTAGSATSVSVGDLPRGTNVITALYSGDANYLPSVNTLNQIVTNHPPVAATMTVVRTQGMSLTVLLSDLSTNWSDVDGDTVTLTGINLMTTNGVNLQTNATSITYTNGPNTNDEISYTIGDGQDGTNIGFIEIVVTNSIPGTNSITSITKGIPTTITALGVPGDTYVLERATNLVTPVWIDVFTNTAVNDGTINVTDSFDDLGGVPPPSSFYRIKWQP